MRRPLGLAMVVLSVGMAACASEPPPPPPKLMPTDVILNAFEIRDDMLDRWEHCPPAGDIGQDWVPTLPEWRSSSSSAPPPPESGDGGTPLVTITLGDVPADLEPNKPASLHELTDTAENQTRVGLRHCYHQGLMYDPTQDGHVALVLRVDASGKVARVETWGACDLAPQALACMRDEAAHVKLRPPIGGAATVVVPAVFTQGEEKRRPVNGGYAASAYVAIESMRERLHGCEQAAKAEHISVFARAVFTIDVDEKGKAQHVAVDQWKGEKELLGCAAEVLKEAPFAVPPTQRGRVVVPIVYNPR